MFLRLLAESLRRGSRRKLLAVLSVLLGTLAATALAEVLLASGDRLAAELASYGANIEVVPKGEAETMAESDLVALRHIFWSNNIVAVAPLLTLRVRFAAGGSAEAVAPLVGTWFAHPLGEGFTTGLPRSRPTLGVEGRWPRDDAGEVAVGRRLAARLAVTAGDSLDVSLGAARQRLTVVGVVAGGGEEEQQAFAPLARVQGLAGAEGRIGRAEVFALTNPETDFDRRDPKRMSPEEYDRWYCTAYPTSVAFQIGQALPGGEARVVRGVAGATGEILGRLRPVLLILAALVAAGGALGVTAAMTATVVERRLEAGLLAALGAQRRQVALFFLAEAALLGLVGGLAGGVAGLAAGRLLGARVFGVAIAWMPVLLPFATALGLAVALVGGLAPVLRAVQKHPATILKRATA